MAGWRPATRAQTSSRLLLCPSLAAQSKISSSLYAGSLAGASALPILLGQRFVSALIQARPLQCKLPVIGLPGLGFTGRAPSVFPEPHPVPTTPLPQWIAVALSWPALVSLQS